MINRKIDKFYRMGKRMIKHIMLFGSVFFFSACSGSNGSSSVTPPPPPVVVNTAPELEVSSDVDEAYERGYLTIKTSTTDADGDDVAVTFVRSDLIYFSEVVGDAMAELAPDQSAVGEGEFLFIIPDVERDQPISFVFEATDGELIVEQNVQVRIINLFGESNPPLDILGSELAGVPSNAPGKDISVATRQLDGSEYSLRSLETRDSDFSSERTLALYELNTDGTLNEATAIQTGMGFLDSSAVVATSLRGEFAGGLGEVVISDAENLLRVFSPMSGDPAFQILDELTITAPCAATTGKFVYGGSADGDDVIVGTRANGLLLYRNEGNWSGQAGTFGIADRQLSSDDTPPLTFDTGSYCHVKSSQRLDDTLVAAIETNTGFLDRWLLGGENEGYHSRYNLDLQAGEEVVDFEMHIQGFYSVYAILVTDGNVQGNHRLIILASRPGEFDTLVFGRIEYSWPEGVPMNVTLGNIYGGAFDAAPVSILISLKDMPYSLVIPDRNRTLFGGIINPYGRAPAPGRLTTFPVPSTFQEITVIRRPSDRGAALATRFVGGENPGYRIYEINPQ